MMYNTFQANLCKAQLDGVRGAPKCHRHNSRHLVRGHPEPSVTRCMFIHGRRYLLMTLACRRVCSTETSAA